MVLKLVYIAILLIWCIYPLESALYRNLNENQDQTIARPGCNPKCGNISIIFPFGMNDPKCYASKAFEIECRHNNNTSQGGKPVPYLKNINLEVMYIDVVDGAVAIKIPFFHPGKNCERTATGINLEGSPFVYSQEYNSFVAVGCQNAAFMMSNDTILTACVSVCYNDLKNGNGIDIDSCRGKYCCDTSLPPNLSAYNISFETVEVKSNIQPECGYALIRADYDTFDYEYDEYNSSYWAPTLGDLKSANDVPAVFEWEIPIHTPNNSFPDFPGDGDASYNCSYTNITSSQHSHSGWRCSCRNGFEGNPYIHGGCKDMSNEEPFIRDNVSDFSDEFEFMNDDESGSASHDTTQTINSQLSEDLQYSNPFNNPGTRGTNDLYEGMIFESKQAAINAIKEFHFTQSYNFDVVESKSDKYAVRCSQYGNGCHWKARASFSKIRMRWEMKKIIGIHSCTSSQISQDHIRLDSTIIAHNIMQLVKTNPGIQIKTLIAHILQRFGYNVSYKKAWTAKQKAVEMIFGNWEQSYSYLPVWMTAVTHFVPGTIVRYKTSTSTEDPEHGSSKVILNRVFWAFQPCIEGFKYCKPIVQVDGTFLTGKYHGTLLTAIAQDGSRNLFPLAFAIVESESKEAWMWFFHYLKRHVTPQPNLCIISDRGTGLIAALQSERIGWHEHNVSSVYCIRHIASNFNKQFKNVDLKKQVINMGYELRKPRFEAKLLAMRLEFPQAVDWLDQIPKSQWTQAYDEGKRYGHMTTNLAECMNSVLKGARALPITALVNETFIKINDSFVTNRMKFMNMIKAGHRYSEDVYLMLQENQRMATSHYVRMYVRETGEFEVHEIANMRHGRAMTCTVKLNEWSCECGHFQAFRIPCSHAIAACASCNLNYDDFVDPVYKLDNICKVYEHHFHSLGSEENWPQYFGPYFMPDDSKRRKTLGRPVTTRIYNEMDEPIPNRPKKCSLCRSEGHNRRNCPYKEVDN